MLRHRGTETQGALSRAGWLAGPLAWRAHSGRWRGLTFSREQWGPPAGSSVGQTVTERWQDCPAPPHETCGPSHTPSTGPMRKGTRGCTEQTPRGLSHHPVR